MLKLKKYPKKPAVIQPTYEYPDECWIEDETPPQLVPSDIHLPDSVEGMYQWDTEFFSKIENSQQSDVKKTSLSKFVYPDESVIGDETPPPLVPSDFDLPDEVEGMNRWEARCMEDIKNLELKTEIRRLNEENLRLKGENVRLKKANRVGLINRFSFEFLLFVAGEVVESFLSTLN